MIQRVASGFECLVQDFQHYTDTIQGCNDEKILTFNVTTWTKPSKQLIDRTSFIRTINVSNQSLQAINNQGLCDWPHVTFINAEGNNISSLPAHAFAGCNLLSTLSMKKNNIAEMYDNAFHGLTLLTNLDLSNNQITILSDDVFKPLTSLKILRLSNNKIEVINSDTFEYNTKLEILDLSYNEIGVIGHGSFWKLKKLATLDVSNNPELKALDLTEMDRLQDVNVDSASITQLFVPKFVEKIFANNNKITQLTIEPNGILEELYLRNNSFRDIHQLAQAIQLNTLDISYNNITDIDFAYLMGTQIQQIIVLENPITTFNVQTLTGLPKIRSIEITTSNLDNQTLNDLVNETKRFNIVLRDPNREQERKTSITMPPVTPVLINEATVTQSITSVGTVTKPVPIPKSTNSKDEVMNDLLKRIKNLESTIETQMKTKPNQSTTPDDHAEMAQSVANLRVLVICAIVAFCVLVSFQLAVFVTANYKRWTIPMPNAFSTRRNGLSNDRRTRILHDSMDPIMEEVL